MPNNLKLNNYLEKQQIWCNWIGVENLYPSITSYALSRLSYVEEPQTQEKYNHIKKKTLQFFSPANIMIDEFISTEYCQFQDL